MDSQLISRPLVEPTVLSGVQLPFSEPVSLILMANEDEATSKWSFDAKARIQNEKYVLARGVTCHMCEGTDGKRIIK